MKVGDLVKVVEPRACGGLDAGRLGLVAEHVPGFNPAVPCRWVINWLPSDTRPASTLTFGRGIEVINESG